MAEQRTIAFFPEGAFGPALNSVGIAQACTDMGHRCVFLRDPGFEGLRPNLGQLRLEGFDIGDRVRR